VRSAQQQQQHHRDGVLRKEEEEAEEAEEEEEEEEEEGSAGGLARVPWPAMEKEEERVRGVTQQQTASGRGVKPAPPPQGEAGQVLHNVAANWRRIRGKEYEEEESEELVEEEEEMESMARICKGLARRVGGRHPGVISAVAAAVVRCRAGRGKRRRQRQQQQQLSGGFDAWLLLLGRDRLGKRRMAEALSELLFGEGRKPVRLSFGPPENAAIASRARARARARAGDDDDDGDVVVDDDDGGGDDDDLPSGWGLGMGRASSSRSRCRMPLDVLADSVRRTPSAVVLLEDIERADSVLRSRLRHALACGRLVDSSGRNASLANAVLLLASSVGTSASPPLPPYDTASIRPNKSTKIGRDVDADADALRIHEEEKTEEEETSTTAGPRKRRCETAHGRCKRRPRVGLALGLDLNMSAAEDENDADADDVDADADDGDNDGACGFVPGFMKPAAAAAGDADILSAARRSLHDFFDLVDAAVVFSTTTTTTTTTTTGPL
jgi:hypothetical protein